MTNEKMNSLACVDAGLAVRALVPATYSAAAVALFARWQEEDVTLIAPPLFAFEVTSTLRRLIFMKQITDEMGQEAFEAFLRLPVRLSHRRPILPPAWKPAHSFARPRAYDTAYLALAHLRDCPFWTADERLYNALHKHLPWVRWIGATSS